MRGLSSVVHEQKNSRLAKHKLHSIFMRYDCFIQLLRGLTTKLNIDEIKKNKISL